MSGYNGLRIGSGMEIRVDGKMGGWVDGWMSGWGEFQVRWMESNIELTDGLAVQPHDYRILNKRRYDCFMGTDLDLLLRSKQIKI